MKGNLGREVHAPSEMVGDTSLLQDRYGPFAGMNPGMAGLEACECWSTYLKTNKTIAEKSSARHFPSIQQALEVGELDNAPWAPGTENAADGLTKVRSDMVSGHFEC